MMTRGKRATKYIFVTGGVVSARLVKGLTVCLNRNACWRAVVV